MSWILIVDNEGPIRAMLAEVLHLGGYQVSVARSGFEALEIAAAVSPDLAMLDVNMPGLDDWTTWSTSGPVIPPCAC
jgi:CheY-like chemotaxis protein